MIGESNQNVFLIQIYASSFAEFEISEFKSLRFDCIHVISINRIFFFKLSAIVEVYKIYKIDYQCRI